MILIGKILGLLKPNQQGILNYAAEHGISQFIEYSPGLFIGVYAERIPFLCIERTTGNWSVGTIKERHAILHPSQNGHRTAGDGPDPGE